MSYETVLLDRTGHLAIITLNRPERLNAVNGQLTQELSATLREVGADDDVRAVILTGAGRGFCSGADVGQMVPRTEERPQAAPSREPSLAIAIRAIPQPVIAAVNGAATGMGFSLALACDIRIASEAARFSSIFVKRSFVPDTGASYMLPRLVGLGIAAEMAYTGNIYDAQWALRTGLVNRVVAPEKLMEEAQAVGNEIAANPPLAVRHTKKLFYNLQELQEQIDREVVGNNDMNPTEDRREAVAAFLERRQPVFKGG